MNGAQDCLSLTSSMNWEDLSCSTKLAVICEAEVLSAPTQGNWYLSCHLRSWGLLNPVDCAIMMIFVIHPKYASTFSVKPHIFSKPETICPASADFEADTTTTMTTRPSGPPSTRTPHSNRHGRSATATTNATTTTTATTIKTTPETLTNDTTAKSCYLFVESKMRCSGAEREWEREIMNIFS